MTDDLHAAELNAAGLDPDATRALIEAALAEDLGATGDVTSRLTIPAERRLTARYVAREAGVIAGLVLVPLIVGELAGADAELVLKCTDGDRVDAGTTLAELRGPARAVLAAERTSLNLLGHLSGVATVTRSWADALAGTSARVRDTRKTMPLLRALEKYAVRCGGGVNHRGGLFDAVLIKDNHVAAGGGIARALDAVRGAPVPVQIEVDSLDQLDEALARGARSVLLDNFTLAELAEGVARARRRDPGIVVEASGGLTLEDAAEVAATGVDYLAVGALTHSARSLDIALDV